MKRLFLSWSHLDEDQIRDRLAWILWGIFILVVTILVAHNPDARSATQPYQDAAHRWWHGEDLYRKHGVHGFLYFPQFAILYSLFTLPGKTVGEVLWRWSSLGLFAGAVWRLSNLTRNGPRSLFLLTTLLAVPAALASSRDGQANMPLAALMIHSAVDLAQKRWNRAAVLLVLCLILKPIALAMVLLVAVFYVPMRIRLALALLAGAALPFLHDNWAYVLQQHRLCFAKLIDASQPPEHYFCDIYGLLQSFGFKPSSNVMSAVRAVAAVVTLGLTWLAFRPPSASRRSALFLLGFAACYLMLFNPKTETNSYVILSPVIAAAAAERLTTSGKKGVGIFLALLALGLGVDNYGKSIHEATDLWFKALVAAVFMGYLIWLVCRRDDKSAPAT